MDGRGGQEQTAASNDNSTKIKCHFEWWIDCEILQHSLISIDEHYRPTSKYKSGESCSAGHDGQQIIVEHLWDYFNSKDGKGSGHEKLLACLKHSLEEGHYRHLGHDSLFELLTGNSNILESYDYKCNAAVRQIVRANLISFITLTNVSELLPFMYQKQLLTCDDTTELLLDTKSNSKKACYMLSELLDTKGHRGYIVFVECLKDSVTREDHHIGHCDIIKKIRSQLEPQGLYIGKCTDNAGVPL